MEMGVGVEEGVEMRDSFPSVSFEETNSCDGGGVGSLGEGEDLFALPFFCLARAGLEVVLGLTFSRNFSFSSFSSFFPNSLKYSWFGL